MKTFNLGKLALAVGAVVGLGAMSPAQAVVVDSLSFSAAPIVIVWGANGIGAGATNLRWAADLYLLGGTSGNAADDLIAGDVYPLLSSPGLIAVPAATSATPYGDIINPATGGLGVFTDNGTSGALDAADVYTAFDVDVGVTDINFNDVVSHGFFVASNDAFDIQADINATGGTMGSAASVFYGMRIVPSDAAGATYGVAFGGNAQDPSTGGTGIIYDSPATLNTTNLIAAGNDLVAVGGTKVFDGGQRTAASAGEISDQSVLFLNDYAMDYDLSLGAGDLTVEVHYTVYNP